MDTTYRLSSAVDIHFDVDIPDMEFYGVYGKKKSITDFLIG